jgi:hypothetical protein
MRLPMQNWTDPRNGWGASIADAMSTMYIMGLDVSTCEQPLQDLADDLHVVRTGFKKR